VTNAGPVAAVQCRSEQGDGWQSLWRQISQDGHCKDMAGDCDMWDGNGVKEWPKQRQRVLRRNGLKPVVGDASLSAAFIIHAAARSCKIQGLGDGGVKWLCYLGRIFSSPREAVFDVARFSGWNSVCRGGGFHLFREFLFSLGFLLVGLLERAVFSRKTGQGKMLHPIASCPWRAEQSRMVIRRYQTNR